MPETPLRVVKPVVVPAQFFVFGTGISLVLAIFPGFFAFVLSNMIVRSSTPVVLYGLVVYLAAFAVLMALMYVKYCQEPLRTSYAIYRDRIEYSEGLFNRHERTILFDKVIDVSMVEGVFQQAQQAGSITLITQQLVAAGEGRLSNRSIVLANIPEPREVYQFIRTLALDKEEQGTAESV